MIGYVYKLTAPNGKIYIGQTINLKRRFHEYAKQRNAHWNGRKHSIESRQKMSESSIGVKGRPKEFLDSIREQGLEKRRTIVLNTETGIFYDSIIKASESISMNYRTFKNKVNGSKRNTTSFILT